jgi:hypothetical protein
MIDVFEFFIAVSASPGNPPPQRPRSVSCAPAGNSAMSGPSVLADTPKPPQTSGHQMG